MTIRVGSLLVGIGVLHQIVGVAEGWSLLTAIARDGWIDSVGTDMPRNAVFWFLTTGVFVVAFGALCSWVERQPGARLPGWIGWFLVAFALLGGATIPVSGLWLALIPGVLAILRARRAPGKAFASGGAIAEP